MEQLIELLQQIQDLAGVGIEALQKATGGGGGGGGGENPAENRAEGGKENPAEDRAEGGGGPPRGGPPPGM